MGFLALFKNIGVHALLGLASLLSLFGVGQPKLNSAQVPAATSTVEKVVQAAPQQTAATPQSFPRVADASPEPAPATPKSTATPPAPSATVLESPVVVEAPATSDLNEEARQAVVNILCSAHGGGVPSVSGSGILIDSRGVILTNAHVAQFFLLADYPQPGSVDCTVRTGSPARAAYRAELVYISPQWVRANAHELIEQSPTGTGEYDYAFLHIIAATDPNKSLPASFPFLSYDTQSERAIGESVLLTGYPAGFLDNAAILGNLYAVSSPTTIKNIYTFNLNTPDLLSTGGTLVAQKGSSGGAVVDATTRKLIGVFVTATQAATTDERDLRAITLEYIDRDLTNTQQFGITSLLSGDLKHTADHFAREVAPTLRALLVQALESR